MVEGLHVPLIPLFDVDGKTPGVAPTQNGPMALKVGVTLAFTVIESETPIAHCPALGVKV